MQYMHSSSAASGHDDTEESLPVNTGLINHDGLELAALKVSSKAQGPLFLRIS